jgi:uncharacterized membrane protein
MVNFLANLIPYFCVMWSLTLLLFNQRLFSEQFGETEAFKLVLPPFILILSLVFILILPIRTCINYCLLKAITISSIPYKDSAQYFFYDYD